MTISFLVALLLRQRLVTAIGLLLTILLAIGAWFVITPKYQASASTLLLPPVAKGVNPYLDLGEGAGVPDVIARVLADSKYADKYAEQGIDKYTVEADLTAGGPAVLVTGQGSTAAAALKAMHTVESDVAPALTQLQSEANVASANLITTREIFVDTKAQKIGKAQVRGVIVAFMLGLVLTLALVGGIDWLTRRRTSRYDEWPEWFEEPKKGAASAPRAKARRRRRTANAQRAGSVASERRRRAAGTDA